MKIAILGYGKMGKIIEELALADAHQIVYKTSEKIQPKRLAHADVAIDFSVAEAAFENITTCFKTGIPVVCGTTGWLDQYEEALQICAAENGTFLYASNFSIGMNLFFQLNQTLAKMMDGFSDSYKLSIEEIHHTQKRDKPSGTAISLAEDIMARSAKNSWKLTEDNHQSNLPEEIIPVSARRLKDVKGTHKITYQSDIDAIEIKHTAFSRAGFAKGALLAAEFIVDKKGVFSMKEVLQNIN